MRRFYTLHCVHVCNYLRWLFFSGTFFRKLQGSVLSFVCINFSFLWNKFLMLAPVKKTLRFTSSLLPPPLCQLFPCSSTLQHSHFRFTFGTQRHRSRKQLTSHVILQNPMLKYSTLFIFVMCCPIVHCKWQTCPKQLHHVQYCTILYAMCDIVVLEGTCKSNDCHSRGCTYSMHMHLKVQLYWIMQWLCYRIVGIFWEVKFSWAVNFWPVQGKVFHFCGILNHTLVLCSTVSWVKISWFASQPRKPRNFNPPKILAIWYLHRGNSV